MKKNMPNEQQKGTILIVNNKKEFHASLKKQLLPLGYKVLLSDNAHDALDAIRILKLDLIITPLHMKNMDGLEFILNLKDLNIQCPVLIATEKLHEKDIDNVMDIWGFCLDPSSKKKVIEITSMLTS